MKVNFTPGVSGLLFIAAFAARDASSRLDDLRGGRAGFFSVPLVIGGARASVKCNPVIAVQIRLTDADLHNIVLAIRFGLECQVKKIVPETKTIRLVVMTCSGGSVRII